jgi:protein-tyrosine-phosphatase
MKVLFIDIENAGRSQMAEAFAKKYGLDAASAGTHPERPYRWAAFDNRMDELGLYSSGRKKLTTAMIKEADLVVAMGHRVIEDCPKRMIAKVRAKLIEWRIRDPKGQTCAEVERISDQIAQKVRELSGSSRLDQFIGNVSRRKEKAPANLIM